MTTPNADELGWDSKDPGDTADYWIDWGSDSLPPERRFLPAGETITDAEVTVPDGSDLVLVDSSFDPATKKVQLRVSGGTAARHYGVGCVITTNTGRVFTITKPLTVQERTE